MDEAAIVGAFFEVPQYIRWYGSVITLYEPIIRGAALDAEVQPAVEQYSVHTIHAQYSIREMT